MRFARSLYSMAHVRLSAVALAAWAAVGTWGCSSSNLAEPAPSTAPPAPLQPELPAAIEEDDTPPAAAILGGEGSAPQPYFCVSDEPTTEVEVVCAARSAASELRRVYLAFAFDVSGSMGGNNELHYNTKWVPVVAATKGFFAE